LAKLRGGLNFQRQEFNASVIRNCFLDNRKGSAFSINVRRRLFFKFLEVGILTNATFG
jgi:hypothetical protein